MTLHIHRSWAAHCITAVHPEGWAQHMPDILGLARETQCCSSGRRACMSTRSSLAEANQHKSHFSLLERQMQWFVVSWRTGKKRDSFVSCIHMLFHVRVLHILFYISNNLGVTKELQCQITHFLSVNENRESFLQPPKSSIAPPPMLPITYRSKPLWLRGTLHFGSLLMTGFGYEILFLIEGVGISFFFPLSPFFLLGLVSPLEITFLTLAV